MKRWVRPHGITLRITLLGWAVTLLTLGVFVMVIVPEQKREFELNLETKARGSVVSISGVAAGAAVTEDYSAVVDQATQVLEGDHAIDYVIVTKNDGFSIVVERSAWRMEKLDAAWHPDLRVVKHSIGISSLLGRRVFQYGYPLDYSGIPWGWIHVGLSLEDYNASVRRTYLTTAALTFLCACLSPLVSLMFACRLVRPIHILHRAVRRLAEGDLHARAGVNSNDEIERLANAFNGMADTILARNEILDGVAFAAEQLLTANDPNSVIPLVLDKIGKATRANRAFVFRNAVAEGGANTESGNMSSGLRPWQMWLADPTDGDRDRGCFLCSRDDAVRTSDLLRRGETVTSAHGTGHSPVSTVLVPIMVMGAWWGVLGLEDSVPERDWGEAEKDSLKAVADMLGASIVRQREQEALVQAKEAAEAANRAKSNFLANMSHELRTPLNAIIGYGEMLQEDAKDAGDESALEDLGNIVFSGRHLLSLINDVLDLSKIEAGKTELFPEEFLIGDILAELVRTAQPLARQKNNELEWTCECREATMFADRMKVRQILFNLLSNACKFTENGIVSVEASLATRGDGRWIYWIVRDTGIGISPAQSEKLFRPFTQADESSTRKYGGTGLGLAISQQLCRLMGGVIELTSEAGRGSVFTVRLPLGTDDEPGGIPGEQETTEAVV